MKAPDAPKPAVPMDEPLIQCSRNAEWEIWHGNGPEDNTQACSIHLGLLMTDAVEHKIFRAPENCKCCYLESSISDGFLAAAESYLTAHNEGNWGIAMKRAKAKELAAHFREAVRPAAEVNSRSQQKRVAAMKGEPFPAADTPRETECAAPPSQLELRAKLSHALMCSNCVLWVNGYSAPTEEEVKLILDVVMPLLAPAAPDSRLPEADELAAEIARAEMHGKIFASAHEAKGVLDEELEEFWEWVMMKRKDRVASEMHKELIQLAAMAIKAIRSMENFVGGDV